MDEYTRAMIVIRRWIEWMHRDQEKHSTDIAEILQDCGWDECGSANVIGILEGWNIKRLHTDVHDPRKPDVQREESALDW